ncbi:MAG: hypothetical protein AB9M53_00500 [Leptothrix sp. (in: b-proteobacteria)]
MSTCKDPQACELIQRNGGAAALSRLTGYSVQRINNWKVRGIPSSAKVEHPALLAPELANSLPADPAKAVA